MDFTGIRKRDNYRLIEPPIAGGGEGKIYSVAGESDKVAKVYHHPEKVEQDKLRFMAKEMEGYYGQLINSAIAWPLDALMNKSGQICGFVMKKFPHATALSHILPDKSVDWGKRVIIAWNLCEIVQDVEKMNQCIGDMNPSNFGVDLASGKVYAFDADSFHFRAGNGKLYPCHVGIAEYYAPELQRQITRGQDMRTLNPEHTFSLQTDRFALAVLIFQLLFEGYHPFSARRLEQYGSSTVVHRQATNILNKVSAYFNPQPGTGIPKEAPPISIIPQEMQEMFRKAFLTENRPSATEWQGSLSDLLRSLEQCGKQHYYYSKLSKCPWCEKAAADAASKAGNVKSADTKSTVTNTAKTAATNTAKTAATNTAKSTFTNTAKNTAGTAENKAESAETDNKGTAVSPDALRSEKRKEAREYVKFLCGAWFFLLLLMGLRENDVNFFTVLIQKMEQENWLWIFFLFGPLIAAYFAYKGKPGFMYVIACIALGFFAMEEALMLGFYLDRILGLNLFAGDSTVSTVVLVVFSFLTFGFGIYSAFKCSDAAE